MKKLLKPLSFIPAILLMCLIFNFSSQTGDVSSQLSHKVSVKIVEAGDYIFSANLDSWQVEEWADKINFITRKLAHMTEYFLLAVAVSFPLYVYGLHGIGLMLVAGIICVGFAAGDEYHQSFVANRGPSVKDVGIDSIGVFFGIIFTRIIGWSGRMTIFRPKTKKIKKVKVKKNVKYRQPEPPVQKQNYYNPSSPQQGLGNPPYQQAYQNPSYQQNIPPGSSASFHRSQPQGYQMPPYQQYVPPQNGSDFNRFGSAPDMYGYDQPLNTQSSRTDRPPEHYGSPPYSQGFQKPPFHQDTGPKEEPGYYFDEGVEPSYDRKPQKPQKPYEEDDFEDLEFFPLGSFIKKVKSKPKSK